MAERVLEELQRIRDRIDGLKAREERARGALEQLLARLKAEYGVGSLADARKLLDRLRAQLARDREALEGHYAHYRKRFSKLLGG
jgi:chromosome segregation ATPase